MPDRAIARLRGLRDKNQNMKEWEHLAPYGY
jgi:hypothetical protein